MEENDSHFSLIAPKVIQSFKENRIGQILYFYKIHKCVTSTLKRTLQIYSRYLLLSNIVLLHCFAL